MHTFLIKNSRTKIKILGVVFFTLFFWSIGGYAISSSSVRSEYTSATLHSSKHGITPGETFFVALHLQMDEGWHTYHKEPGDVGLATSIDWLLPDGITAGEIIWPTPIEFETAGIQSFGYEKEVYLRVPLKVSETFESAEPVTITAQVTWLECKEICIPGEATLTLQLPIDPQAGFVESAKWNQWESLDESTGEKVIPLTSQSLEEMPDQGPETIWAAIALAFGGGLILNLMPCVFPVLGIKILGFVNHAGDDPKAIRLHGMIFTLGILISFWLLVGVLIALRSAGEELGWGFQLQNPLFIAFLVVVFFLFSLNLLGVFEFGLSLTSVGSELSNQSGLQGSFFSGALTTIVATPCTAPFMGSAIGYGLNQPSWVTILVFTSIALGLATPYLILSFFPQWINELPRPGAWMDTLKQFFAFPMIFTVIWLLWVFGHQTTVNGIVLLLTSLATLAFGTWLLGKFAHPGRSSFSRYFTYMLCIILLVISIRIIFTAYNDQDYDHSSKIAYEQYGIQWEPFSPERIQELRSEGYQVYVDFTAKWCTQCLSNKKIVFNSPGSQRVIDALKETKTVTMVADWTKRDPMITAALEHFGRAGVPFNVVYPSVQAENPIILPTILTQQIVIDALQSERSDR